jgi:hypothetical protein
MKMLKTIGVCIAILLLGATAAGASDSDPLEIEGSYILYQNDGHQRVLSFNRSGNAIQASDLETVVGFSSGLGAWEQTGPDSATARLVNFNFNVDTGKPMGSAIVGYDLKFRDLVGGKYQTVTGSLSGGQYDIGQDPLAPTTEPYLKFQYTFEGKRITAK